VDRRNQYSTLKQEKFIKCVTYEQLCAAAHATGHLRAAASELIAYTPEISPRPSTNTRRHQVNRILLEVETCLAPLALLVSVF
jgi:hypothetical protein